MIRPDWFNFPQNADRASTLPGVQPSYLSDADRQKMTAYIRRQRDAMSLMRKRMEQAHWFTQDATYLAVCAACNSLDAAVQILASTKSDTEPESWPKPMTKTLPR